MINRQLAERLTKDEYLIHQVLVGSVAVLIFYWRFAQSGPVCWLDNLQAMQMDGDSFPVLSLVLCLALFIVPWSGLFLRYAHFKQSKER